MRSIFVKSTYLLLISALTACYSVTSHASAKPGKTDSSTNSGYRIYNQGLGTDNRPISSTGAGKTSAEGGNVACANCHRRSGYGTSEGGLLVPPVTGLHLFNEREFKYRELDSNSARPITRHAYTRSTLKKAIREGIDANGRKLDQVMPRYDLTDKEADQLIKYLSVLGSDKAEGIDENTVHIATIITDDTEESRKKSHLDTLQTFITTKNAETRLEGRRKENTPWHKQWAYSSYRKWQLHIWKLTGKAETWQKQLADYYQSQPVFSVVGGISDGEWAPVHRFCESIQLPCIFPTINKPETSDSNLYNVYFSRGLLLESDVISGEIIQQKGELKIIQFIDNNAANNAAAERTRQQLMLNTSISVSDHPVDDISKNLQNIINSTESAGSNLLVVLWADAGKLLPLFKPYAGKISAIYTSSENLRHTDSFTSAIPLFITHRHLLNAQKKQKLLRLQFWLKSKKLEVGDINSAANAYFAVNIFNKALRHLRNNFSREYLIERIEHIVENAPFQSNYTTLSLGSEQRFASKGSYLLGPLSSSTELNSDSVNGRWIVPGM